MGKKRTDTSGKGRGGLPLLPNPLFFFFFALVWASWWMGDVGRVAYERSFFAADSTLMTFLWQQPFGSLWILGRALLTLYRWPLLGGAVAALMLALGSWLLGYCLRLGGRWRWLQYLPAAAWMLWVSLSGFELYYQHEPGRPLGILLLGFLVVAIDGFVISTFSRKPLPAIVLPPTDESRLQNSVQTALIAVLTAAAFVATSVRHPYLRPVTRMEVQMLSEDWQGMAATARDHASLSYRPIAAYYAIALTRTGRLADDMFRIRLDYDSLLVCGRAGTPDIGTGYYQTDCDYHAGLLRAAEHSAMEMLTMDGPSLYALKHLARLAILHSDYALARKYLYVISRAPFERSFVSRYEAMLPSATMPGSITTMPGSIATMPGSTATMPGSTATRAAAAPPSAFLSADSIAASIVGADPVFAAIRQTEPVADAFESQFQAPVFLGYFAVLTEGRSLQALNLSLMANLYSKRMPEFLVRCQPYVGQTPPQSVAEGLITQAHKNPQIMQAFPALQMDAQRYRLFLQAVSPYMGDRAAAARRLFPDYAGYYPYYYLFGNLKATRKSTDKTSTSQAGVN